MKKLILVGIALAVGLAVGWPASVLAGLTDAQKCESYKLKHTGKYGFCQMKAQSKFVKRGDPDKLNSDLDKCDSKVSSRFDKADEKWGSLCPAGTDLGTMQEAVTQCADDWAVLLSGGSLPGFPATGQTTPYGAGSDGVVQAGAALSYTDNEDGTITDNNTGLMWEKKSNPCPKNYELEGAYTAGFSDGDFTATVDAAGTGWGGSIDDSFLGFVNDCGGTVTDTSLNGTCLGGAINVSGTIDCVLQGVDITFSGGASGNGSGTAVGSDVHDVGKYFFDWSRASYGTTYEMDGMIVSEFLDTLNDIGGGGASCFAGYCDWRIPNVKELQSIVDYEVGDPSVAPAFHQSGTCTGCTDVTQASCSCTFSSDVYAGYWSSTSDALSPVYAWAVFFYDGSVYAPDKEQGLHVRAVRGGL